MFTQGFRIASRSAAISQQFARNMSNQMATYPRVRVSFAEKCVHGVLIGVGLLAVPAYVAVNFKNYRAPPEQ